MFMGLGMPIPDLSNKPGPGRPGWGPLGSYDFQFRVEGTEAVVIKANAAGGGSFTVQWPNGTTQVLSGNNASITAPDATDGIVSINNENDADYCDNFAVVGGKDVVREVISWGQNAWSSMASAFNSCANLTSISETVFTAAAGCNMRSMLNNCDSLTIAKINNWDLSAGIDAYEGLIRSCDNLEELDATGLVIKISGASGGRTMFGYNGNNVANGCLFKMSGMDFSSTTISLAGANSTINMFAGCRFADGSDLSNWNFPATWNGAGFFASSKLVGTNAVLNISNWDNYPGVSLSFSSMNSAMGDTGAKINLTNLNLSNFNNMAQMFYFTDLSQIIGISTWNATAGNVNAYRAFWGSNFLSVTPTDNFSNAFIQSLTPTNVTQMFSSFGNDNENVAVNLNGLDLSNITTFSSFMSGAKFSTAPDFSNVTFPSTAISWDAAFYSFDLPDDAASVLDFSTVTAKISSLAGTFSGSGVNEIKFGNNVDFSQLTSFNNTFYNPSRLNNPQFPTNADFGAVTDFYRMFYAGNSKFSTCQADNFIRRLHATAFSNNGNVPLNNSQLTGAPSVVRTLEAELVANGWTITENSTDATMPFEYPSFIEPGVATAPTNNTGGAFTGTFTSSDPTNIPVVASGPNAGLINTTNTGNATIRYTLSDGCYTEQAILVASPFTTSWNIDSDFVNQTFNFRRATTGTVNDNTYFDYQIDWGDGSAMESFTDNTTPTHTYTSAGTYDIKVVGMIPGMTLSYRSGNQFYARPEAEKLLEIKKWGDCKFSSFYYGFGGCKNMTITATDNPTFRQAGVTGYMNNFFRDCRKIISYDFTPWQTMLENIPTGGMEYLCSGAYKMEYVKIPSCTIPNNGGSYNDSIFNSTGLQAGIEILNAGSGLTAGNYTTTDTGDFAIRLFEVDSNGSAVDGRIGLFNADGWAENAVFNFTGGLQVRINKAKPGCKIIMKDITWSHDPRIRSFMYNAVVEDVELSGWTITTISQMQQWFFINNANYQQMTVDMSGWTATGNGITSMRSLMTGNRYDSTGNFKGPKILKTTNWDSSVTENLTDFGSLGNASSGKYSRLREWWGLDQIKLGKVTNFSRMFEFMNYIVFKSENGRNFANDCFNNRVSTPSSLSASLFGNGMSSNVDFSQESNAEIINLSGWTFDAGSPVSLSQAFYNSNHPGDDTTASGGVWWDLSSTDMSNVSSLASIFRRVGYTPNSSPYVNRPTEKRTIKINDLTSTLTNMSYLGQQSTITDYDFTGCDLSNVTTLERVFSANINRQSPKQPYTFTYSNTGNLNSITNGISFVDGSTPLRSSDYDNILRALGSTSVTNGDFRSGATTYDGGLIFTDGRTPEQMTDTTTANKVVDENKNFVELGVATGDIVEIRRANSNPIVYASITAVSETELTLSASIIVDNNYRYYNIQTSDAAKDRFALDVTNSWYILDGGPTIE